MKSFIITVKIKKSDNNSNRFGEIERIRRIFVHVLYDIILFFLENKKANAGDKFLNFFLKKVNSMDNHASSSDGDDSEEYDYDYSDPDEDEYDDGDTQMSIEATDTSIDFGDDATESNNSSTKKKISTPRQAESNPNAAPMGIDKGKNQRVIRRHVSWWCQLDWKQCRKP